MKDADPAKPQIKNHKYAYILAVTLVVAVAMFFPIKYTDITYSDINFATIAVDDANMELGHSKVIQEGKKGVSFIKYEMYQSLIGRSLGIFFNKRIVNTGNKLEAVDKKVANGVKRWQYMVCSDGSYRHYTNEQMKDKRTGFTSKSADYCKANGNGTKVSLVDSPPVPQYRQPVNIAPKYTSSYTSPSNTQSYNYEVKPFQYTPLEYKAPTLKEYTTPTVPKITVQPPPSTPRQCYYYAGNGWCN